MCGNCKCKGHLLLKISKWLLIIGGINWGVLGLGMLFGSGDSWNIVRMIFGSMPFVEGIIYVIVGVAAIMKIFGCKHKNCSAGSCAVEEKKEGATM